MHYNDLKPRVLSQESLLNKIEKHIVSRPINSGNEG